MARSLGRRDHAAVVRATTEMLAADPSDTFAANLCASAQAKLGQSEAACRLWKSVLEREPTNLDALRGLAEFYVSKHQPELACEALRRALLADSRVGELAPFDRRLLRTMGFLFGKPGMVDEAAKGLRRRKRWEKKWRTWAERFLAVHEGATEPEKIN